MKKWHSIRILFLALVGLSVCWQAVYAQTFTLSGTVTDPNSLPVANVTVQMYTYDGYPIGQLTGITDTLGFYSISGIPGGTYGVGFRPRSSTHLVPAFYPGVVIQSDVTLDVTLQFGDMLSGYVTDTSGVGLVDIDLNVYDEATGIKLYTPGDNTDQTGFYRIVIPSGTYRILYRVVDNRNLVPVELRNVPIVADTTIDVVLSPGVYIVGTVLGPGGVPVVDADMDAVDSNTGIKIYTPNDNTDSSGHYVMHVPASYYDINVAPWPSDGLLGAIVYNVPVLTDTTVVDFQLEAGISLSGFVRGPASDGVFNADIDVLYSSNGQEVFTPFDKTDSTGFYEIIIPQGTFDIEYEPPQARRLQAEKLLSVPVNMDTSIAVALDTGMVVSGTVIDSTGTPLPDIGVFATVSSTQQQVFTPENTTDSSGFYQILIHPDVYDLTYAPDTSSGLQDSMILYGVNVARDTVINVVFSPSVPDTLAPTVTVLSPNGGEVWNSNSIQTIAWSANDDNGVTAVDIYYSTTGQGGPYNQISTGEPNDGSYSWLVPETPTQDAWVKITAWDGANNSAVDFSDSAFAIVFQPDTIPPTVTVISPNGGEVWDSYTIQTIAWSASDDNGVASIDIYYSTTGQGGPYNEISTGEPNDGSYDWIVPATPTQDAWVRIMARDGADNLGIDFSDAAFTIVYQGAPPCGYTSGDVNGNGVANVVDVTYLVNFLGGGPVPPDTCFCPPHEFPFYGAADVNGNCAVNVVDVTYLVNFFAGTGPALAYCVDCPPGGLLGRRPPHKAPTESAQ